MCKCRYLYGRTRKRRLLSSDSRRFSFLSAAARPSICTLTIEYSAGMITAQIAEFNDLDAAVKNRKKNLEKSVNLLDAAIQDGAISDAHLRMLVEQITVFDHDGKLKIQIDLNGDFRIRMDEYGGDGNNTDHIEQMWGCDPEDGLDGAGIIPFCDGFDESATE